MTRDTLLLLGFLHYTFILLHYTLNIFTVDWFFCKNVLAIKGYQ